MSTPVGVHLVTLGCARNEVDSEELAGRLAADGFALVDDPQQAQAILVNTCGFIDAAKKDSIDTLLAAADLKSPDGPRQVVAVGCMAERYGSELAAELPEADAVWGFDAYPEIGQRLRSIMAGEASVSHTPTDRRRLLPLAPAARPAAASEVAVPGHLRPASGPLVLRRRLERSATAPLKIASGCDRKCAFCAIPSFRGSFLSRPAQEIVAEAAWLVEQGVREVVLVSENSSSYGKDLGDPTALENLLVELDGVPGLEWIRVSYLQPAEVRPGLISTMSALPSVVGWVDLPFQHAAPSVLRRMRRFGDPDSFLGLIRSWRERDPRVGIRSNVIVGFPGETEEDLDILLDFLAEASLDAVGVFGYSDEEGTEGHTLPGKLSAAVIAERVARVSAVVDELVAQRAEDRIGERVRVLIEEASPSGWIGRASHQGPETDGSCEIHGGADLAPGQFAWGTVTATDGVDLVVEVEEP